MSEQDVNLATTIYSKPECGQTLETLISLSGHGVTYDLINITDNDEAQMYLKSLRTGPIITPTVVSLCSCGKHKEWWSGKNIEIDRAKILGDMVRGVKRKHGIRTPIKPETEPLVRVTIYTRSNCKFTLPIIFWLVEENIAFQLVELEYGDSETRDYLTRLTHSRILAYPTITAVCICGRHKDWLSGDSPDLIERLNEVRNNHVFGTSHLALDSA